MSSINERLQIIVNELFDGNKAKFAKSIEIAPTSISNYLSDKRQSKPSADMLEKIINVVECLSAEWLLTGKGEMLKSASVKEEPAPITSERLLSIIESQQRTIENLSKK